MVQVGFFWGVPRWVGGWGLSLWRLQVIENNDKQGALEGKIRVAEAVVQRQVELWQGGGALANDAIDPRFWMSAFGSETAQVILVHRPPLPAAQAVDAADPPTDAAGTDPALSAAAGADAAVAHPAAPIIDHAVADPAAGTDDVAAAGPTGREGPPAAPEAPSPAAPTARGPARLYCTSRLAARAFALLLVVAPSAL